MTATITPSESYLQGVGVRAPSNRKGSPTRPLHKLAAPQASSSTVILSRVRRPRYASPYILKIHIDDTIKHTDRSLNPAIRGLALEGIRSISLHTVEVASSSCATPTFLDSCLTCNRSSKNSLKCDEMSNLSLVSQQPLATSLLQTLSLSTYQ